MPRPSKRYLFLIPLFTIALGYRVAYTLTEVYTQVHNPATLPEQPFLLSANGTMQVTSETARRAGVRTGARLLEINGQPAGNVMAVSDFLRRHRPGDRMEVVTKLAGEEHQHYVFLLAPESAVRNAPGEWVIAYLILLVALLSVMLGVYVAGRLPRDIAALSLFGILAGLNQFVNVLDTWMWPRWASVIGACYTTAMMGTWPIWMMLFGIYFPERSRWDVRWPVLKWLLIIPIGTFTLFTTAQAALGHFSFDAARELQPPIDFAAYPVGVLSFIAPAIFFVSFARKTKSAASADARRRLRILWVGSTISLTPMVSLVLYVLLFARGDFGSVPQYIEAPVILLLFLFPVTLAYVVLAQRALELKVALRMGLRYTFAKTGLRVLIGLAVTAAMWGLSAAIFTIQIARPLQILLFLACALLLILLIRRMRARVLDAVDRRFFREAYDSELILNELSDSVRTMIDERALVETVVHRIAESLHVDCVAFLVNENGALRPQYSLGCESFSPLHLNQAGFIVEQVRNGKTPAPMYPDVAANWILEAPPEELETIKHLNAQLLIPVVMRDRLLGILSLGPKRSEEPYSTTDIQLLKSVAFQTGLSLENSRLAATIAQEVAQREKLNREIEIAREVQETLFPHDLPSVPGIDYSGACRPALGVGGDYYDFVSLAGGKIGVAIGDVSGKGIAAALLMASLQASLRGQALQGSDDLTLLMRNVNRLVFEATPPNRYATFFYAQYDLQTRRLMYVNAGHNPPMILRKAEGVVHTIRLETGGPVIGLFREAPYQQGSLTLEPGDILIGFTDGISEAMNSRDEEWGEERLVPALEACAGKSAQEMIPSVMAAADQFADGTPQHDDMTLVVMKLAAAA